MASREVERIGPETAALAQDLIAIRLSDMPDQSVVFQGEHPQSPLNVAREINAYVWLVFFFPALFIALGAALVCMPVSGWFLGWVRLGGFSVHGGSEAWFWNTAAGQKFTGQLLDTISVPLGELFSPVFTLSWIFVAVGLGLVLLSFLLRRSPPAETLPG